MGTVHRMPYRAPVLRSFTVSSLEPVQSWAVWRADPAQNPGAPGDPEYAVRQALATVLQGAGSPRDTAIAAHLFSSDAHAIRQGYGDLAIFLHNPTADTPWTDWSLGLNLAFIFPFILFSKAAGASINMMSESRIRNLGVDLAVIYSFRQPRWPDAIIAAAVRAHGGNQVAAARALGVSQSAICQRLQRAAPDSPLADPTLHKRRHGQPKKVSDAHIAAALRAHGGNQIAAARALGVTKTTICQRLQRAASDSPLADPTLPKRERRGRPKKVSDDQIAAALRAHGGHQIAAARALGVTGATIGLRLQRATPDSPLADPALPKPKRGWKKGVQRVRKVSDDQIAAALRAHGGNQTAAARALGVTGVTIWQRRQQAIPDSPLADPTLPGRKGRGQPKKVSDAQIAAALRAHGGNQNATARALGVSHTTIYLRLQRASPDSPLADPALPKLKRGQRKLVTVEAP